MCRLAINSTGAALTINTETLNDLLACVRRGGAGGAFLGQAYLSWYWTHGDKISLCNYSGLGEENRTLFHAMLQLRHQSGWSDEELFDFAKLIKAELKGD